MVLAPAGSAAAGPAGRFAGVELGGTKVVVTLADGLDIVERHSLPTTNPGDTLGAAVDMLAAWDAQAPLAAIGIASFGPIRLDPAAADYGTMLATTKPGWAGAGVVAAFASRFDCPVALDTDVNGAGIAEAALGAGQGCRTIVYLTIGTGVGGGVIVDGWPAPGRFHPEIGHLRLRRADGDGFAGTCSFHGDCIEGLISGPALRARFGRDPATVDPVDPAWDMVASDLAELFAALMLTLSPDRIVVGGSVALGQPDLVARATRLAGETLATYIGDYDVAALSCIIGPPMLGHDAGPLGSILLAIRASQCGTPGVTTGLRSAALRDSRG
ncbi:ROK family protein [Sphingopyxis sp. PET50]|uniref:ROK family protein n=1 Tax=Sphingopyxis sp. PET50 TaxID=2976533 RepID=UPI0021AFBB9F|nr:ROK family protein [Sphingopyxis sp. PET50]